MNLGRLKMVGLILGFSLVPIALSGTEPYQPKIVNPLTESWRWRQFPELEGKGVRYVAETKGQRVWVSCNEGVMEYDGYTWKTHDERLGLKALAAEQLLVAKDNSIYATASNGIFRYNGINWTHYFQAPSDVSFIFHGIRQLSDNSIIACSDWGFIQFEKNGLLRFFTSSSKIKQLKNYFPKAHFIQLPDAFLSENQDFLYASDIQEVENGSIWFALTTQMELGKLMRFRFTDVASGSINKFEVIMSNKKIKLGEDQKLLFSKDLKLWVVNSTSNKGVSVFDGKKWDYFQMDARFGGDDYMTGIVQSANGTIWIGSMAKIFAFTNGSWEMYRAPQFPIPANRVILLNGQQDQLWVAGYKSKVLQLDFSSSQWLTYSGLSFQFETSKNNRWYLEVNNKIVHQNGNNWLAYTTRDGLMDAPISVIKTSKGQIWAAGSHGGVAATALLKNDTWELHLHSKLSWGIDYRSVFESKDGTLWFGGSVDAEKKDGFLSGLLELPNPTERDLKWIHHTFGENGLNQANVYGIGQSKDGKIWIGGSRLYYYDGKTWKYHQDQRLQQFVNIVHSTDNLLLVGSRYYGVFVFDGETWVNYNTSSGLSGNTVISIDALSDSSIIVATENDICRFDGRSWTQNIYPEKLNMDFEGGTIQHTKDAIWVNHVPRSWKRRAYQKKSNQAERWEFYSTIHIPDKKPPRAYLDIYSAIISKEGNTHVSWKGADFFAKTPANLLSYSYRLDQGDWSVFSRDNRHIFTGLGSGKHILEVYARDLDFNIDPTPAKFEFSVMPPIWKQGWFITLMLAILTLIGIYEFRLITKKRKLEILNSSLQVANQKLQHKSQRIEAQNREILAQQEQIINQAKILELSNKVLEDRNIEIELQRDKLEDMVEKVEQLSNSRLAFFTNISHELRTPLTLILGPVQQLQNEHIKLSNEERTQLYDVIQRNASRLLKLINQLLEMRLIEHNILSLNLEEIHLADYLSEIVLLFQNLALKRDIYLDFTDNSEDVLVSLDSDKVEKILVNLLSNAFKHTPDGGSIQVTLNTVKSVDKKLNTFYSRYFEIIVEDTGSGISKDKLDFIFEKYYTTNTTVIDTVNSGIGLSYIKELLYLLEGDIRVESELDRGTCFMIYLPFIALRKSKTADASQKPKLSIAPQEAALLMNTVGAKEFVFAEHPGKIPNSKAPTILVVEDNSDMLQFLSYILSPKYRVVMAENGLEGLKRAQQLSIDLIISDVMMPEMDGLTFCEKIKTNFATSHIPVILLTAKVLDEDKMSSYLKGADDYITKPFNPEMLLVRSGNLLQQRKQLRESFSREFILTPKHEEVISPDEDFLSRLVNLMNENLSEAEFNVEQMCKSMYLSHMHFIRKVKQLTGKKPIDLLKSFRMKKAKDLLAQQRLSVSEVAYKVGFDLSNSFSRAFKKEFKITPSQFMESLSEQSNGNGVKEEKRELK